MDFPPLRKAIAPGDRVVIALDRHTPHAAVLVRAVWDVLERQNVRAEDLLILQPAAFVSDDLPDPRDALPAPVRSQVRWSRHDPTEKKGCAYLASTTSGQRIYLAREAIDADLLITIGPMMFDSVLGYRGTNSVLYPGLSALEDVRRAHGQGHDELGPDDVRALRQTIDEVGWLLGVQFTLQVLPSRQGGVAAVLAGSSDAVYKRGREQLATDWSLEVAERPELVVVAVDDESRGRGWELIGAALETARQVVAREGRILLLTDVREPPTGGFQMLRDSRRPRDVLRQVRREGPPDLLAVAQVARALDWANVYFLSGLADDVVEELFMIPLGNLQQVERLVDSGVTTAFIGSAHHTHVRVRPTGTASTLM